MPEAPRHELLVFTRYPRAKQTKTRLAPALGAEGAADLHRRMTEQLVGEARKLPAIHPVEIRICFDGGDERRMRAWLGPDLRCAPQQGDDLGQRMARALGSAFQEGAELAVLVGTDVPDLTAPILYHAFRELEQGDVVLGPAEDGGYYLIGLRRSAFERACPRLFSGISWGTGSVLSRTLRAAEHAALRVRLTDRLADVDRSEDLELWERRQRERAAASAGAWISVIVPTLNEAAAIGRTLAQIPRREDVEVIVADGGSSDGTPELARAGGARVMAVPPPRARQMNLGAAAARGDIYLFLHADTLLPEGFEARVRRASADPSVAGGAFPLRIESARRGIRWVERGADLRTRYLALPYGDQALFVRARLFWELGGFPLIPIMEDYVFVRRLAGRGRLALADRPVWTSGRRWERLGIVRTTLVNQLMVLGYSLGIPPERLARWYRRGGRTRAGGR